MAEQVVLDSERETMGLYLTGHPINQYLKEIERYVGGVRLKDMHPTERGKVTMAAGLVIAARVMVTKRGNRIGICTLDDRSGRLEVMLFTDALDKYQQLLEKTAYLSSADRSALMTLAGSLKMTAREVMDIDKPGKNMLAGTAVSLTDRQIDDQLLNRLPSVSGTPPFGNHSSAPLLSEGGCTRADCVSAQHGASLRAIVYLTICGALSARSRWNWV